MHSCRNTAFVTALILLLAACSDQTGTAGGNKTAMDKGAPAVEDTAAARTESSSEMPTSTCDRDCLIGVTKTYLSALVAHNPDAAPLSGNVRFVENIKAMMPGEGLWQSVTSGPTKFAIYVPDEVNQTAGFLGMMTYMATPTPPMGATPEERAKLASAEKTEQPVMVAIRLKLENGKITEAEHLLAAINKDNMANVEEPRAGLVTDVPADKRMDHDKLIKIGASYYDALDDNDGSLMPFAADCERHENGMITAGANAGSGPNFAGSVPVARDCAGQLTSKIMTYIDRIENRRVFAADPVTGLVMGLSHFRHPMNKGPYEVTHVDGSKSMVNMDERFGPFDLPAAHIFKIGADGEVHEIEAMGFIAPYNSPTGWEKWESAAQ